MIAAIRIRGLVDKTQAQKSTFERLRLRRKHVCVLLEDKPEIKGMLKKIEDFIAYGEIDKETLKELILQRGRLVGDKRITSVEDNFVSELMEGKVKLQDKNIKQFFRLHPPKKGFGVGGIKKPTKDRGVLGNHGKKINDLIKKML